VTGNVVDTALGIALVASALGKKVPRVTPTSNAPATTECYIELEPARKKSQTPVSVAPPNYIDSNDAGHGDTESEIRLSQSDIHIEFPGEICGMAAISVAKDGAEERFVAPIAKNDGVATLANAMSGVGAHEEVGDAPTDPGEVVTPMSGSVNAKGEASIMPDTTRTPTTTPNVPGSAEEKVARKVKYDAKQKMLREIAANQLFQEELAKANLNLVSVSSYMNKVCGIGQGAILLKETAELFIQRGISGKVTSDMLKQKGTTLEKDGVFAQAETILILSPTTVSAELGEFMGEHNSVVALGEPRNPETSTILVAGQTCETLVCGITTVTHARDDTSLANDVTVRGGDIVAHGIDESDTISLDGTVMSIGRSSSEGSTAHSKCGSSVSANETRKRAADESLDREHEGSSRRNFPGRVTRSAAGCRVYIPPMIDDKSDCPDRILNDDGTCVTSITVGQGSEDSIETVRGDIAIMATTDGMATFAATCETNGNLETSSRHLPVIPVKDVPSTPEPFLEPTVALDNLRESAPATGLGTFTLPVSVVPSNTATLLALTPETGTVAAPTQVVVLVNEWGRDTCIITEVCAMIEEMACPWSAYRAFEAASARFPNIDCAALCLAVMAVLMGQRRCVNRITNAGLASGSRRDVNGATYIKLNNACGDDYRNSY